MSAKDPNTIEGAIEHKTGTGDYYPMLARALRSGTRPAGTGESVNIAATILKTEGDWFGLRLHMMFPNEDDARAFVEPLLALIQDLGLNSARELRRQWLAAKSEKEPYNIGRIWLDDCGPLTRDGVREANVAGRRV